MATYGVSPKYTGWVRDVTSSIAFRSFPIPEPHLSYRMYIKLTIPFHDFHPLFHSSHTPLIDNVYHLWNPPQV